MKCIAIRITCTAKSWNVRNECLKKPSSFLTGILKHVCHWLLIIASVLSLEIATVLRTSHGHGRHTDDFNPLQTITFNLQLNIEKHQELHAYTCNMQVSSITNSSSALQVIGVTCNELHSRPLDFKYWIKRILIDWLIALSAITLTSALLTQPFVYSTDKTGLIGSRMLKANNHLLYGVN